MEDNSPEKQGSRHSGLRWMGAGVEFCGVICLFSYIGYRIDRHFDTSPFLLLTGFFIGFTGMLYLFYKESK